MYHNTDSELKALTNGGRNSYNTTDSENNTRYYRQDLDFLYL